MQPRIDYATTAPGVLGDVGSGSVRTADRSTVHSIGTVICAAALDTTGSACGSTGADVSTDDGSWKTGSCIHVGLVEGFVNHELRDDGLEFCSVVFQQSPRLGKAFVRDAAHLLVDRTKHAVGHACHAWIAVSRQNG
jgi:hypothetical protein